jgi:hypothetical protein
MSGDPSGETTVNHLAPPAGMSIFVTKPNISV